MTAEGRRWQNGPLCIDCWQKMRGPVEPVRFLDGEIESCALCSASTEQLPGIYLRMWLPSMGILETEGEDNDDG